MEGLNELLGIGVAASGGGILGLVGGLFSGVTKYFHRKQELKEKDAERQHELALFDKELTATKVEDAHEIDVIDKTGSWRGLESSIEASAQPLDVHKWVNDVKALTRPVLTVALLVCTAWVYADLSNLISGHGGSLATFFDPAEAANLLKYVVYSVVFTSSSAALWYFGDRACAPPGLKNR